MAEYMVYGDISPRTQVQAYGKLLKETVPGIVTEKTAQTKPMKKNTGRTMIFRRYLRLDPADTPLMEGVAPLGSKVDYVDVEVTIEQYGDWIGITDVILDTHEDPVLTEFRGLQNNQMRSTREVLNFAVLKGGTNVFYANGTERTDVNTPVGGGVLKKVIRDLNGSDAAEFMSILSGSAKYGTSPIPASYFGMGHTDNKQDLQAISSFVPVHEYAETKSVQPYEVGEAEGIRFMLTTLCKPWADAGDAGATMIGTTDPATAVDVYPLIIVAKDAWGSVPLRGAHSGSLPIVQPKPAHGNELGQQGSLGWKFWHAALILNDDCMARVEGACTLNPS